MNNFEKEAQKRSVTKMFGRALNPMEWIRQMSSGKYRRLIAAVDAVDKTMRDNVMRLKPDLRERLHQARMAMKNRDFLRVFQYTNSILDSVNGVFIDQIDELDAIGREIYSEFSQNTMDEFDRQQLEEQLGIRKVPRIATSPNPELVIEAGVTQWLQEKIPTKKELEGVLFDKIFRNMQGKQQNAAREAMAIAEGTYALIDQAFAVLDDNRRNIMEYVRLAREYQKKLAIEKEHLKRMYVTYFPSEPVKPAEVPQPPVTPPPVVAPETTTQPVAPSVPPSAGPILPGNPPNPKAAKAINDMIVSARTAILNGRVGIGTALLAQASELCDQLGDEQRSIGLLKVAADLDRLRGQTIDICYLDVSQDISRFSKERIAEAFDRGYKNPEAYGTPKVMIDGKEIE